MVLPADVRMPFFPPVHSLPPLKASLLQWMDPPDAGPVWFEGPERLRRMLVLQSYVLVPAGPVRQVVWVDALPRERRAAVEKLRLAAQNLMPQGRILTFMPAVSPEERGWLSKLQVRTGLCVESCAVSAWFLEAALAPVVQAWPQGLRSWVMTAAFGLPISHVLPVEPSQSSDILPEKKGGTS